MRKCCCYVIDPSYILPALVSAGQIRRKMMDSETIISIFCLNPDPSLGALFKSVCASSRIEYADFDRRMIDNYPIMFGRFFLDRLIGHDHGAVLYLDSDTQVLASLDPLLSVALDRGKFIAARDPMSILLSSRTETDDREYFDSIGIPNNAMNKYLNSGVLRFNLSDITEIRTNVLKFVVDRGPFRFPDQDPLNLAYGNNYLTMSYSWNFPAFFLGAKIERVIPPKICHFMSNPRPWDGPMLPYGSGWWTPYRETLDRYPVLKPFVRRASYIKYTKYLLQQQYKRMFEIRPWMTKDVLSRILAVEQESYV